MGLGFDREEEVSEFCGRFEAVGDGLEEAILILEMLIDELDVTDDFVDGSMPIVREMRRR